MAEADLTVRRGCLADVAAYWRGMRLVFDLRGRSSRTEIVMLYLVPMILYPILLFSLSTLLPTAWEKPAAFAVLLLTALPLQSAAARRFHDMGKSGWFAAPMVFLSAVALWDAWLDVVETYPANDLWHNRGSIGTFYGIACIAYFIALMQPPRDEGNRYGPNPRPAPKEI